MSECLYRHEFQQRVSPSFSSCFLGNEVVAFTKKEKCFSKESDSDRRAHIPSSRWGRPSCCSHTTPESAGRLPGFCLRAEPRALDLSVS